MKKKLFLILAFGLTLGTNGLLAGQTFIQGAVVERVSSRFGASPQFSIRISGGAYTSSNCPAPTAQITFKTSSFNTAENLNRMYSTLLAALLSGKRINVYSENASPNCDDGTMIEILR